MFEFLKDVSASTWALVIFGGLALAGLVSAYYFFNFQTKNGIGFDTGAGVTILPNGLKVFQRGNERYVMGPQQVEQPSQPQDVPTGADAPYY